MQALKLLQDIPSFSNKTILVRIDCDVDIENDTIIDDTRLRASFQTIRYITERRGNVIAIGHLGRPEGKPDPKLSLLPIAYWYAEKLQGSLKKMKLQNFPGWKITDSFTILENIRFFPGEEQDSAGEFGRNLANLGEFYVNEAFAVSHRNNASITEIPKVIPGYAGFNLEKEVKTLSEVIDNPNHPFVVILGGAKIETKLPLVENMQKIADFVLVGGKLPEEKDKIHKAGNAKLVIAQLKENGLDITSESVKQFAEIVKDAKLVVWNGPLGKSREGYEESSIKLVEAITESGAQSVVGGGDTLAFLKRHDLMGKFTFVSTGGGAMLEFLAGKQLPGLTSLYK